MGHQPGLFDALCGCVEIVHNCAFCIQFIFFYQSSQLHHLLFQYTFIHHVWIVINVLYWSRFFIITVFYIIAYFLTLVGLIIYMIVQFPCFCFDICAPDNSEFNV